MKRFLENLLGQKAGTASLSRKSRVRLGIEELEARIVPVTGTNYDAAATQMFNGVGEIKRSDDLVGTAVVLADGRHILTAAHMVDWGGGNGKPGDGYIDDVSAQVIFTAGSYTLTLSVTEVSLPPGWDGDYGKNDLAIFTLAEALPDWLPRYDIYRDADEVGQLFTIVGYGQSDDSVADRQYGFNRFDSQTGSPATQELAGFFDAKTPTQNSYLQYRQDADWEAAAVPGDSGGPLFIGNKIAGITSWGDDVGNKLATRVSMFSKWIDETMGVSRDLVLDTRTLPGIGNNGAADVITVQTNAYGDMVYLMADGIIFQQAPLRQVDSITIIGSDDHDTISVGGNVNRLVRVVGGANDSLLVDGSFLGYTHADYTITKSHVKVANAYGITEVSYSGFQDINVYTHAGEEYADKPSEVVVQSLSSAALSIHTGSGDFAIEVGAISRGGVNLHTHAGTNRIQIGSGGFLTHGQVNITGTGYNSLIIDDTANSLPATIIMTGQKVTINTLLPNNEGLNTVGVSFDHNFIKSLVVKAGTPDTGPGNTIIVRDTPSRVFGSTAVTLFTGGGNDDVYIEALSSPLSLQGQDGQDTVNVGQNNSMASIRFVLAVANELGSTQLNLLATADNADHNIVMASAPDYGNYITGLAPAPILYGFTGIRGVSINTGAGQDVFDIVDAPANTDINTGAGDDQVVITYAKANTRINTGAGDDQLVLNNMESNISFFADLGEGGNSVTLGGAYGLGGIRSPVELRAENGTNVLVIEDRAELYAKTFSLTSSSLERQDSAPILFADVFSLIVYAGEGRSQGLFSPVGNTFHISDTLPLGQAGTSYTTIFTGTGRDSVNVNGTTGNLNLFFQTGGLERLTVGDPDFGLNRIQGAIGIYGEAEGLTMTVDDSGADSGQTVTIGHDSLQRSGAAPINFGSADSFPLFFQGSSGDDTIHVLGKRGNLTVLAGAGDDQIHIGAEGGLLSNLGHFIINGEDGVDSVFLHDEGEAAAQTYEFFNIPELPAVPVFTTSGTTIVFAAMDGDVVQESPTENVVLFGGQEADTFNVNWITVNIMLAIDAGAGNDIINGGAGREVLIGGPGEDVIAGGGDEDVLIAGDVAFDVKSAALVAVIAEWGRNDLDYADRVAHLFHGGGLNGATLLNHSTYTADGGRNTLTGGLPALDLLFGSMAQDVHDWDINLGEIFIDPASIQDLSTAAVQQRAYELDQSLDLQLDPSGEWLNWGGRNEKWVMGNSGWHFILPNGELYQWTVAGTFVASLDSSYYQDLTSLVSLDLHLDPSGEWLNWGGLNEKWVMGNDGWHFITPNGELYKWVDFESATGTLVATLDGSYYQDLTRLVEAQMPLQSLAQARQDLQAAQDAQAQTATDAQGLVEQVQAATEALTAAEQSLAGASANLALAESRFNEAQRSAQTFQVQADIKAAAQIKLDEANAAFKEAQRVQKANLDPSQRSLLKLQVSQAKVVVKTASTELKLLNKPYLAAQKAMKRDALALQKASAALDLVRTEHDAAGEMFRQAELRVADRKAAQTEAATADQAAQELVVQLQSRVDQLADLNEVSDSQPDVVAVANQLVADLGLGSYHPEWTQDNWLGQNERWILSDSNQWYFITPDGGFYGYNGSVDNIELLATLDQSYWEDLGKLTTG